MIEGILKRNEERQKRIAAAGIEYECPDFVSEYFHCPFQVSILMIDVHSSPVPEHMIYYSYGYLFPKHIYIFFN